MGEKDSGYWFTTENGVHIHVSEGETPEEATNKFFGKSKEYRQNTSYAELTKENANLQENLQSQLTEEERATLRSYKIPKEPIIRKPADAEKWKKYDQDYTIYMQKEPKITADMDKISEETGMPLIGRDFRLKSKGSYDRKVNDKRLNGEYKPLGDVIRYTFEHPFENSSKKIKENLDKLKKYGYNISAIDNKWKDDGAYNGINVDVVSPDGIPMEIQYTTKHNAAVKEEMHVSYEILRDRRTPENIRGLAERQMQEIAKKWVKPKDIEEV